MPLDERPPAGPRGRTGASAEVAAGRWLSAAGWVVLARNLRVGPDELDLVALDPQHVPVVVEVRARSGPAFGSGTESVDTRKVGRLYRAAATLRRHGHPALPLGSFPVPLRVDLVTLRRDRLGRWQVEAHLRGLEPPEPGAAAGRRRRSW
ncbi:MAG: YraN family protein [Candidatus Limnocylindrales bacterium]